MGDISTIVTMGFGSFGSVNLLPVLGFYLTPVASDTGTAYYTGLNPVFFGGML